MMKRLLPVAAAVVIGLSPSFASAQGKVGGAVNKGTVTHSAVEHAMHDLYGADFGTGKAFSLATGRLSMAWGAAASWVYQDKNGEPRYISTGLGTTANGSKRSGNELFAGADLDLHFKATSDVDVRMTLSAGPTLRGQYFQADTNVEPSGGYAGYEVADTGHKTGFRTENLYMTYQYNPSMGAVFGWHTSAMTTGAHLGANQLLANWDDLLEYTGVEAGVRYQGNGFTAGLSLLDPGHTDTAGGINSRLQHSARAANPNNWIGDVGYDGKGGNFSYGVHIKRMKYAEDLTMYQALGATVTAPARAASTDDHNVTSYELSVGNNNFDAGFTRVDFKGDSRVAKNAVTGKKKWDLWHVGYKSGKMNGNAFYHKAGSTRFAAFGKDEFGVEGGYALSNKMAVNAIVKHIATGEAQNGVEGTHHATQFALGVSLKS